jgi:ligand-binding sensor domain-containing protein
MAFMHLLHTQTASNQWRFFNSGTLIKELIGVDSILYSNHEGMISEMNMNTGQVIRIHDSNSGFPLFTTYGFNVDSNHHIWAIRDTVLWQYDGQQWQNLVMPVSSSFIFSNDIAFDGSGNLWISFMTNTYSGLAKYSGSTWTIYTSQNSALPFNVINQIIIDSNDKLWLPTAGGGLVTLDGITWQVFNTSNSSIPSNNVRAIELTSLNTFWIGTSSGASYFNGLTWNTYTSSNSQLIHNSISEVDIAANGHIYFSTDQGLSIFQPLQNLWTNFGASNSSLVNPNSPFVFDTYTHQNGYWYAGTTKGLMGYDGSSFTQHFVTYPVNSTQSNSFIPKIYQDTIGYKWLATDNRYWTKFDGNDYTTMSAVDMTNFQYTNHIWLHEYKKDNNNNLWGKMFPYGSGLEMIAPNGTRTIFTTSNSGLPSNSINDVECDAWGNVWIAGGGGITKFDGNTWITYNSSNSPLPNQFTNPGAITMNPSKTKLWALYPTSSTGGIASFDGQNWTTWLGSSFPYQSNIFTGIVVTNDESVYLQAVNNTTNPLVRLDSAGNWFAFTPANVPLFNNTFLGEIVLDRFYNIWLGATGSLIKYDGNQFTQFTPSPLAGGLFTIQFIDQFNNIWFTGGSSGFGFIGVFNEYGVSNNSLYPITGSVYFDANNDGLRSSNETGMAGIKIIRLPDSLVAYTNSNGNYWLPYQTGPYQITIDAPQNWQISSDSLSYTLNITPAATNNYNFGLYSTQPIDSGTIYIVGATPTRCNQPGAFWINYSNLSDGYRLSAVTAFPDSVSIFLQGSPTPTSQTADSIVWNTLQLPPYQMKQIMYTANMPSVSFIGDTIRNYARLELYDSAQSLPAFTSVTNDESILICAYDPNDKTVFPSGDTSVYHYTPMNTPLLKYLIRFQNTGNDTAFDIRIADTLHPALNHSSFRVLASSHLMHTSLDTHGVVTFFFPDILLPDSNVNEPLSHGFILYEIEPGNALPDSTAITNTAYIFFDFNPPIITNTTLNTFVNALVSVPEMQNNVNEQKIKVYPNPASDILYIQQQDGNSTERLRVEFYDLSGRLIKFNVVNGDMNSLTIADLISGSYIIRVCNENQEIVLIQRIVVQH